MLSIVVILCLASCQVFGAAVLHNAHADAKVAHDHAAESTHSDGEYHEAASSKHSAYSYEKASGHGATDGHAVQGYNNHAGYAAYGFPAHYAAPAAHHGAYVNGHNEYDYSYARGQGYNHEDSYEKDYKFNNDAASESGNYAAASQHNYNNGYAAAPVYHYGHPGYYNASPFLHALHKRSVGYGYPAYRYGYNGHPAYNGYYGNYHGAYPYHQGYYGNYHGLHKRSVYNGYYGNHYGAYPAHYGYRYGYPAYNYGYYH